MSVLCFAQQYNKTFFLLGTMHDYMGKTYLKNHPTKSGGLLTVHQSAIGEMKRIEKVIGEKFQRIIKTDDCSNCHEFYELNSKKMAKQINSFNSFEKWSEDIGGSKFTRAL